MAWRGYLDDMLALLDVKLLTPLLEPDAPSAAGSLEPLWSCGSEGQERPEAATAAGAGDGGTVAGGPTPPPDSAAYSAATWREYWRASTQVCMAKAATRAAPEMRNSAEKLCTCRIRHARGAEERPA